MALPVDPRAIATLRDLAPDDPGFVRDLIDAFASDLALREADLERAIAARDAALLAHAAHTIKGSAGNFGAEALASAAFALEQHGRSAAFAEASAALPALRREAELVTRALQQYR